MEELMKNLYLFLTEAERGDVLRIHVTETDECYEFIMMKLWILCSIIEFQKDLKKK